MDFPQPSLPSNEINTPRAMKEAVDDFYPGWAKVVSDIGRERGWPPMTRRDFEAQIGPEGALMIGDPDEVAEKILRHSDALGGISRVTFQMNAASLVQEKMTQAIELIGTRVAPAVRARLGAIRR